MSRPSTSDDYDYAYYRSSDPSASSSSRAGIADPLSQQNPRYDFVQPSSPSVSFGRSERFLSNRIQFISRHHNQDALCTHSPGPVYQEVAASVTSRRVPTLSWGEKPTMEQMERRRRFALTTDDIGPAAYTPSLHLAKPAAPRAPFPKADRFRSANGIYQLNNSPDLASNLDYALAEVKYSTTSRASPSYSFGPKGSVGEDGTNRNVHVGSGRVAIFNQSIRGGFSRSATLESGIGPADYCNYPDPISKRWSFGSAPRFLRPGLQFVSAQHAQTQVGQATPGAKYVVRNFDIGTKTQARGAELKWMP